MVSETSPKKPEPSSKSPAKPKSKTDAKSVTLKPATVQTKSAAPTASKTATIVPPAQKIIAKQIMKKPELIDKAVERSGVKKKDAKPAIEAALSVIVETLANGQDMSLPPLGKIKLVRSKELTAGAKALTLRLRTMKTDVT